MNGFYKAVGYVFKNDNLAKTALTHGSYANERGVESYQRLEFLGDSILSLVVSEYIFKKFHDINEGELTKIRAASVCERSLYEVALKLGLREFILLNRGEEATGGRDRASILSDITEAIIAAIYLDGGLSEAKKWIVKNIFPIVDKASEGKAFIDYKTELQELMQSGKIAEVSYHLVGEDGPAHMKVFEYEVRQNGKSIGKGRGKTKKEAEQLAAKAALEVLL